jgi:hypothetical protein
MELPFESAKAFFFILNIVPLFLIMDGALDKYNYAKNGLQNIRKRIYNST